MEFFLILLDDMDRELALEKREEYERADTKDQKTNIAIELVELIHRSGGRFLTKQSSGNAWEVIAPYKAREKASEYLREAGRKKAPPAEAAASEEAGTSSPPHSYNQQDDTENDQQSEQDPGEADDHNTSAMAGNRSRLPTWESLGSLIRDRLFSGSSHDQYIEEDGTRSRLPSDMSFKSIFSSNIEDGGNRSRLSSVNNMDDGNRSRLSSVNIEDGNRNRLFSEMSCRSLLATNEEKDGNRSRLSSDMSCRSLLVALNNEDISNNSYNNIQAATSAAAAEDTSSQSPTLPLEADDNDDDDDNASLAGASFLEELDEWVEREEGKDDRWLIGG